MSESIEVYRDLQKHLDKMPVGFPATKSGVEIDVLKMLFTPQQAKIVTYLDYKFMTVNEIFETAKQEVDSKEKLKNILDEIVSKGGISRRERQNEDQYATAPPILWGIYEYQLKMFNPEFLNRIDRTVIFRPLSRSTMREILKKELRAVLDRRGFRGREWAVEWDAAAVDFLLDMGFTRDLGARPLKRAIERYLLSPLALTIATHQYPAGNQFLFVRRQKCIAGG